YGPPQVWRQASRPLIAALHAGRAPRPPLPVAVRREVLTPLLDDIAVLEELTGESFADWRRDTGRGDFRSRQSNAEAAGRS
ncbi:MAG TPA: sulfotransferase, partial [Blastococcus sp.]